MKTVELTEEEVKLILDMLDDEILLHGDLGYCAISSLMKKLEE